MRRFACTVPLLLILLLVFVSEAAAQAASRVARIGMLCAAACSTIYIDAFFDELRKLGWVEGTTFVIDRKYPERLDQLPALAADMVRSKPDLIVAVTVQAARAIKNATSDIPVVMLFVGDPV